MQVGIGTAPQSNETEEFADLALSAGADVLVHKTVVVPKPRPRYLIGSGKVDELAEDVAGKCADLVLFSCGLSPSQERNLEKKLHCRVLDRNGLILDIFAQRARSFEGKLQVELAQLRHLSTRLVRGWTHLERQAGGIGLRGPGESQLETDRRLLGARIKQLKARLQKVDKRRSLGRLNRIKAEVPVVALVGYTNAGKTTLFNRLTDARAYAADQLFATLDPTLRKLRLGDGTDLILADTVGFVRDLPHELVAAFRSTLTETRDASLILHVIDSSDPHRQQRIEDVNTVLTRLNAREIPQIQVYNKIDLSERSARLDHDDQGQPRAVWISSTTGAGLDLLDSALVARFHERRAIGELDLSPDQGRQRAMLFKMGAVSGEVATDSGGWCLSIDLSLRDFRRFCQRENILPDALRVSQRRPVLQRDGKLSLTDG